MNTVGDWRPDPFGRYRYRYMDADGDWTESVCDSLRGAILVDDADEDRVAPSALAAWNVAAAERRKASAAAAVEKMARLRCHHCGRRGLVTTRGVVRKQGISGGKATGALFTGGFSMLFTGLSRRQRMTEASCGNCGSTWSFA